MKFAAIALSLLLMSCGAAPVEPVSTPLSEAEQFKERVFNSAGGASAMGAIASMDADGLIDVRGGVIEAVKGGATVDSVIAAAQDAFQQQGHDRETSRKMAEAIVEESLGWNAEQK